MVTYDDWYAVTGSKLEDELLDWYSRCPSGWIYETLPAIAVVLSDEYESYISEIEDYQYECYKDSLMDI